MARIGSIFGFHINEDFFITKAFDSHICKSVNGCSLLPLNHDDVITEFGFHRWIGVDRIGDGADGQREGGVLERSDHRTSDLPAEISALPRLEVINQVINEGPLISQSACLVFTIRRGDVGKLLARFQLLHRFEDLRLLLAQNVPDLDRVASFLLLSYGS